MLLRPARPADLPALLELLGTTPVTSSWLGDSRERLAALIESSEASLASEAGFCGEESYFFVLEGADGALAGCSALLAAAGFAEPFYSYRNETFVHASRELKIHNRIHVLSLCHDLTGSSLLTACQLQLGAVAAGTGLDLQGRLLFIAAHPERFAEELVAELAGEQDASGNSPFWEGVGRNFLGMSHDELRERSRQFGRGNLAELMPGYPLYVPLLPDSAQEAIGQVHHACSTTSTCCWARASPASAMSMCSTAGRCCNRRVPWCTALQPAACCRCTSSDGPAMACPAWWLAAACRHSARCRRGWMPKGGMSA